MVSVSSLTAASYPPTHLTMSSPSPRVSVAKNAVFVPEINFLESQVLVPGLLVVSPIITINSNFLPHHTPPLCLVYNFVGLFQKESFYLISISLHDIISQESHKCTTWVDSVQSCNCFSEYHWCPPIPVPKIFCLS